MKDAKCKICRREGKKLFLKGERCYTAKCPLVKRKYPPGIHGPKGYPRLSEYGLQLREKQQLKRIYGVSERQLKKYFNKAKKAIGNTEFEFLKQLETRQDSVIYNAGLAFSRSMARQIINHGHVLVNDRKVTIPSYQVKIGDILKIKEKNKKSKLLELIKESIETSKSRREIPAWFDVDDKKLEIKIVKMPDPEDLPKDLNIKLIIEFYSR